ncbi:MAG: electron transfer flavoprotein subunit alpha/FixB family protein [Alphaproteobacteria bacterium]|nr:electron transfer flavoprotein subunit alpha/FixB family protein [Alphaproteobacteria bacterium]
MSELLVIAEHDGRALAPAVLSTVTAASALAGHSGGRITLLVAGQGCRPAAEAAALVAGVGRVLLVEDQAYAQPLAEALAPLVARLAKDMSHVLAPATSFGKDLLPRAAALADAQPVADAVRVIDARTLVRPIYAGNLLQTVRVKAGCVFATIRPSAFAPAGVGAKAAPIEAVGAEPVALRTRTLGCEAGASSGVDLGRARVVLAGGRGMGSAEGFKRLEPLAKRLGAALAATRAAVDAGYAPNEWQVGQTGRIVAPELYIAFGISGAIQHLAGIKDSKTVVAINKDVSAPIFAAADYGLVMDLFQALPELEAALADDNSGA